MDRSVATAGVLASCLRTAASGCVKLFREAHGTATNQGI